LASSKVTLSEAPLDPSAFFEIFFAKKELFMAARNATSMVFFRGGKPLCSQPQQILRK
jgi:hypothetical protein